MGLILSRTYYFKQSVATYEPFHLGLSDGVGMRLVSGGLSCSI